MLRTADFVAERLNVPLARVYAMARAGDFPPGVVVRFSVRTLRFSEERLNDWISGGGAAPHGKRGRNLIEERISIEKEVAR